MYTAIKVALTERGVKSPTDIDSPTDVDSTAPDHKPPLEIPGDTAEMALHLTEYFQAQRQVYEEVFHITSVYS